MNLLLKYKKMSKKSNLEKKTPTHLASENNQPFLQNSESHTPAVVSARVELADNS